MRILIGTVEIGGFLTDFADGFRRLGHEVTTVIRQRYPFYPELQYDVDLKTGPIRWPESVRCSRSPVIRLPRKKIDRLSRLARLLWLIASHDVFFFQWDSLRPLNRDYPVMKRLGKKIVSLFVGSDVRHASAYKQQFNIALENVDESYRNDPLVRLLRNLRMGERYSDLILSVPNQSGLAVRPYMHFFIPLDLPKYRCNVPGRDIPVIVHAPSVKSVKGTDVIVSVLERLRSEGVSFELRLLHGVPNKQVLTELADADVAIDQLNFPLHGLFGGEAMASGCALATCNSEEHEPLPPKRPIWNIDPANLYDQLKRLLTNKELRIRLASEGRQYVERYHDHVSVARRIIECLDADELEQYDHYPVFFARKYRLPEGETIPKDLQKMTAQIVQRWGLPEDVDPQDMIARGLMSAYGLGRFKTIHGKRLVTRA